VYAFFLLSSRCRRSARAQGSRLSVAEEDFVYLVLVADDGYLSRSWGLTFMLISRTQTCRGLLILISGRLPMVPWRTKTYGGSS